MHKNASVIVRGRGRDRKVFIPTNLSSEGVLSDHAACFRVLQALKAGRAPREGIRFLSVGLDGIIKQALRVFERAQCFEWQNLWLIGDPGDGKSHLLRIITELARDNRFIWAYVVHDKDQLIGLHKPAHLLRRILWEIQWNHPSVRLERFSYWMNFQPSYREDQSMRKDLPIELQILTNALRYQDYKGLVVCLDELENCRLLHWSQVDPACETLMTLCKCEVKCPIIFCLGATPWGWEYLKNVCDFPQCTLQITIPKLNDQIARQLADRIWQLHAAAFQWQPAISVEQVFEQAWQKANSTPSGRWRVFVQEAITVLEIAHQCY